MRRFTSVALAVFGVFVLAAINLHATPTAYATPSSTINFQARLQSGTGGIVPDGDYNVQFKLYDAATSGTLLWTETYLNANSQGLSTRNGYLTVQLGSLTAFPSAIDWSQQLYLTMNIGGTVTSGTFPTIGDGEMDPRLPLTAVPYAFRAGSAASADQLKVVSGGNTSTLSIQAPTGGSQTFQLQDQGASGTYNILTTPSGTDGYIKLQTSTSGTQQTGNFNISGTGIAGTLQSAAIVSSNSTNSNTVTIGSDATASSYTIKLPASIGTADQCLVISSVVSTTANLGWADCGGTGGSGSGLLQGGNSFGEDMVLGTNDAYGLNLTTDGVSRLSLTADGAATIQNSADTALAITANSSDTTDRMLLLQQDGTADASIEFNDAGGKSFFVGMDQSDGGTFKISSSTSAAASFAAGTTTPGTAGLYSWGDTSVFRPVTVGGTGGTLSSISAYIRYVDGTDPGLRAAIYADNGGEPGALIAGSAPQTATLGWNALPLSANLSASTTYWLAINLEGSDTNLGYTWCGCGTGALHSVELFSSSWDDPAGASDGGTFGSFGDYDFSVYMLVVPEGAVDSFEGVNLLSVSDTGAVALQNSVDGRGAFRVLNAAGVPQFSVDTGNSLVYVGNSTADSTGALLILDTKNTSDDPTGIPGAMYYNSHLGVSRCFIDDYWRDCVDNERTSYNYVNDFMNTANDNDTMLFDGDYNYVAPQPGHPGLMSLNAANTNDTSYMTSGLGSSYNSVLLGDGTTSWRYETALQIPSGGLSGSGETYAFAAGFTNATDGVSTLSSGCYFRYSDSSSNWEAVCENSNTETSCDTNVLVSDDTWYRLTVSVNADGTAADFFVDGVNVCQVTSNIPSSALSFQAVIEKTAGSSNRSVVLDYLSARAQFASPR